VAIKISIGQNNNVGFDGIESIARGIGSQTKL